MGQRQRRGAPGSDDRAATPSGSCHRCSINASSPGSQIRHKRATDCRAAHGRSTISAELSAKRLELLREIVPNLSRAAIIWAESNPPFALTVRHTQIASQSLGVALRVVGVHAARDFEKAAGELAAGQVQGVIVAVPAGSFASTDLAQLTAILAHQRLPAIYAEKEYVHAGGLVSYGPDYPNLFRQAATYTDKILRGMQPADLPVEQPTKFESAINHKTALALGLNVPPPLLAIADEMIE